MQLGLKTVMRLDSVMVSGQLPDAEEATTDQLWANLNPTVAAGNLSIII
jgi:hypothetical protein